MSTPAKKTLTKFKPIRGRMPVLQFCAPDELLIDAAYQRGIEEPGSQRLIRQIAENWDWTLCQPLIVAARGELNAGGSLFVIDGQHRLAAARLRGDIAQLPCILLRSAGANEEAGRFVQFNQDRRALTPLDLFRAALAGGDPVATAITAALDEAGLTLAPHTNPTAWKPGQIANVGGIRAAWKRHGATQAARALGILATAFEGQVLRLAGTLYPGIAHVCGDRAAGGLTKLLASRSQEDWRTAIFEARAQNPSVNNEQAGALVFRRELRVAQGLPPVEPVSRIAPAAAPVAAPVAGAAPVAIVFRPGPDGKAWCEQCDRGVALPVAQACQSRFCSLRVAAPARKAGAA